MEVQATRSAVLWDRVRILQNSSKGNQSLEQKFKIFQFRKDKNPFSSKINEKKKEREKRKERCTD